MFDPDQPMYYILTSDGEPAPCPSVIAWGIWFQSSGDERVVAREQLPGDVVVSTVFLGIDHNWSDGPPILFETMIFGGAHDQLMRRYYTRAEARAGHAKIVAELRGILASAAN